MVEQNSTNASDSTTRAGRLHVIIIFSNPSSASLDYGGQRVGQWLRSVRKSPVLVVHGLRVVCEAELEGLLADSITLLFFFKFTIDKFSWMA